MPLWLAGDPYFGRRKSLQFVDSFWETGGGRNLFFGQSNYDSRASAGALVTASALTALGVTDAGGIPLTYIGSDNLLQTKSSGTVPVIKYDGAGSQLGLLCAPAATNLALYARDLTNVVWVKVNATTALTATGVDGAANSATVLTATSANGTALQTLVSTSAARITSAYVKRVTGSGTIQMTQNAGTTWTTITTTTTWTRFSIPTATAANPILGFRIVTSGDAIQVDYVQHELGPVITPAILTTSATASRTATATSFPTTVFSDSAAAFTWVWSGITDDTSLDARYVLRSGAGGLLLYKNAGGDAIVTYDGVDVIQTAVASNQANTAAMKRSSSLQKMTINGGAIDSITWNGAQGSGSMIPTMNGVITRLAYRPSAVTDAELIAASGGTL